MSTTSLFSPLQTGGWSMWEEKWIFSAWKEMQTSRNDTPSSLIFLCKHLFSNANAPSFLWKRNKLFLSVFSYNSVSVGVLFCTCMFCLQKSTDFHVCYGVYFILIGNSAALLKIKSKRFKYWPGCLEGISCVLNLWSKKHEIIWWNTPKTLIVVKLKYVYFFHFSLLKFDLM